MCWMRLALRGCFVMKLFLPAVMIMICVGVANASAVPAACQPNPNNVACDNAIFNQFMAANSLAPSEATAFRDENGSGRIKELHVYRDANSFENLNVLTYVKKFFFRKMTSAVGFPLNPSLDTMSIEYVPLSGSFPPIPAGMKTFMIWGSSPSEIDLTGTLPALPTGIQYFLIGPKTKMVGPLPSQLRAGSGSLIQFMLTSSNDLGVLPTPLAQSLTMLIVGPTSGSFNGPLPANLDTIYLWPGMTGLYPSIPDTVVQGSLAGNSLQGVPSFWFTRINWFPMNPSARPVFTSVEPSTSTAPPTFVLEGHVTDDLGVIRIGVYVNGLQVPSWAEADFARGWHHFTANLSLPNGNHEIKVVAIDTSGQFASYTHSYTVGGSVPGEMSEIAPSGGTIALRPPPDRNGWMKKTSPEPEPWMSSSSRDEREREETQNLSLATPILESSTPRMEDYGSKINWEWVRSRLPFPKYTVSMDREPIYN